jgi:hypothetical protein
LCNAFCSLLKNLHNLSIGRSWDGWSEIGSNSGGNTKKCEIGPKM